jgi:hypothetical protein
MVVAPAIPTMRRAAVACWAVSAQVADVVPASRVAVSFDRAEHQHAAHEEQLCRDNGNREPGAMPRSGSICHAGKRRTQKRWCHEVFAS